jgi:amino acid permease
MKKFIEKMKTKSDADKRIFAFSAASLITILIFCIWLISTISFYNRSEQINVKNQANPLSSLFGFTEFGKIFSPQKDIYQNK